MMKKNRTNRIRGRTFRHMPILRCLFTSIRNRAVGVYHRGMFHR